MKKYRVDWIELQGYYVEIQANSEKEALELFEKGETGTKALFVANASDFCQTEQDSIEATEIK